MSDEQDDPARKRHPFEDAEPTRQFAEACRCRGCGKFRPCAAMHTRDGQHYCPNCVSKRDR
jgi:hypothetical protein